MNEAVIKGIVLVAVMAVATAITRFLPFFLFPAGKKTPKYISYLGTTLPYAAMGLLVVYCLKGVDLFGPSHGIPEILAVLVTAGLHLWKGNSLLSIGVGTAAYMVLVQLIFV